MAKTNVEVLTARNQIGEIREHFGIDPDDTSKDDLINNLDARHIARAWSSWNIGSDAWADDIINLYEAIKDKDTRLW
jgi:hypothetical protein